MAAAMVASPIEMHRGNSHAGDDHAQRQREFHLPQQLAVGHAHAASGFDHGAINAFDAGVGVANERQQRVEREREDGEAVGAGADPGRGQKKSEERQAGNGLNNVGAAEYRLCSAPASA